MGEAVQATIDVEETKVHLKVLLPGMLGMFSGVIQAALQKKGGVLLEDHRTNRHCEELKATRQSSCAAGLLRYARNDGEREAACGISRWSDRGRRASIPPRRWRRPMANQARIDILDRYPVPYGLIRFGVAPDHQSLKAVSKRYDKVAESAGRRLHRQCRGRPRRLGRRAARALRRRDPRDRRAARPQARHSRRGSAGRGRLGRVRRLVQRPSRFRRPRPAARRRRMRR